MHLEYMMYEGLYIMHGLTVCGQRTVGHPSLYGSRYTVYDVVFKTVTPSMKELQRALSSSW